MENFGTGLVQKYKDKRIKQLREYIPELDYRYEQRSFIKKFWTQFYQYMDELDIKQSDIAYLAGKTQGWISKLPHKPNITLNTIFEILGILGLTIEFELKEKG